MKFDNLEITLDSVNKDSCYYRNTIGDKFYFFPKIFRPQLEIHYPYFFTGFLFKWLRIEFSFTLMKESKYKFYFEVAFIPWIINFYFRYKIKDTSNEELF